jgi:hypothetical protein
VMNISLRRHQKARLTVHLSVPRLTQTLSWRLQLHSGYVASVIDALQQNHPQPDVLRLRLIEANRHPPRGDEVAQLQTSNGG